MSLADAGAGAGKRIPIVIPRSLNLVLALLAVLKTGACYALLDKQWPRAQLEPVIRELDSPFVIDDSGASLMGGAPVWSPPMRDAEPVPPLRAAPVNPREPCCVFFTSGTSGRPKGVVVPHRAISRLFSGSTFARFDENTVIPLSAATPWDAFALELWGSLLHGGTAVVVEEPFLTPDTLRRLIGEDQVNTVWLTSSLFNMILDEDSAAFEGLGQLLIGGERLSTDHVRRFLDEHPSVALTNGYGPVESTVFASAHRVMPMDHLRPGGIPLGVCVPGTRVYVLDGTRECGRDEEGEICITGDGLAIEYMGDPELTARMFSIAVLDGQPTRVYRTGDLGLWRSPDGLLEFRGRMDRQVKVRGHRVEPAEIERAIVQLAPAVRACRVIPRRSARDDAYELVAFCIPQVKGDRLDGLPDAIGSHLPAYQRPAQLVVVSEFPLNDRGKTHDGGLLEVAARARGDQGGPVSPVGHTPASTEDLVTRIFAEVLGLSEVPADTSFFALGGSSLDAGRVCARLGHQTGLAIPVSQFYEHQTIEQLTPWLEELTRHPGSARAPVADDGIPLTDLQTAFLIRDAIDPAGQTNHCLIAWRLDGPVDLAALMHAISWVHARHEALRAAYALDPRPHARLIDVDALSLRVLSPADSVDSAVARLTAELAHPFDPDRGLVWRAAIVPVGSGETSVFGCGVHHVAFDGWSEAVLADDLSHAYNGGPATAPPPGLRQLSSHRSDRSRQADTAAQVSALAAALTGVPEATWPQPDAPGPRACVGAVGGRLSPATCDNVTRLGLLRGTTRFPVLLTAWGWALHAVIGTQDICVGVPVSDRALVGGERAIGCQLFAVPVRLRGACVRSRPDDEFTAGVDEAARQVGLAMACQEVPLSELIDKLRPEATGRTPIYQTMFALQDNRIPSLKFTGLTATTLRLSYLDVPTDLHCELWPQLAGGMAIEITYKPERVRASTAQGLLDAFTTLLERPDLGTAP